MASAAMKNGTPARQLVREVAQLPWEDFQEFIQRALALRPAPPEARRLSAGETALLLKINEGPPPRWHTTYAKWIEKRRAGRLTLAGEKQLLKLVDKMERYNVRRMEWLTDLARIRKVPLRALIASLGIKRPEYV
jgi:hypothetical protein